MSYILEFWRLPVTELTDTVRAAQPVDAAEAVELVRERGTFAGSVDHSSAGGDWFRGELMGRLVAGVIGAEAVEHLLGRPIEGVVETEGYPALGWLSRVEIDSALAQASPDALAGKDNDDVLLARTVVDALRMAQREDRDLVTVYG